MTRLISGVALAAAALAAILFLPLVALRALAARVAGAGRSRVPRHRCTRPSRAIVRRWPSSSLRSAGRTLPARRPYGVRLLSLDAGVARRCGPVFGPAASQRAATELVAPVYIGMPLGMLVASGACWAGRRPRCC